MSNVLLINDLLGEWQEWWVAGGGGHIDVMGMRESHGYSAKQLNNKNLEISHTLEVWSIAAITKVNVQIPPTRIVHHLVPICGGF